jgi:hypothetical protein
MRLVDIVKKTTDFLTGQMTIMAYEEEKPPKEGDALPGAEVNPVEKDSNIALPI